VTRKAATFWPVTLALLIGDCTTKQLAVAHLTPPYLPHDVFHDILRFTLAYNPGAAFSMSLGSASRWGFTLLALIALATLAAVYRSAANEDVLQAGAIALIAGGALGNLVDRVRSARGVVDFIDIGFGDRRFWTFNVADMGVTCGAVLLAWVLWKRPNERPSAARE
jgi:signal peptidase II